MPNPTTPDRLQDFPRRSYKREFPARLRRLWFEVLEDRRVLAAPCNTGAVNWPPRTTTATTVSIGLTDGDDLLVVDNYTDPSDSVVYLALFDNDGDGVPCWTSKAVPFTAAVATRITIDAYDGADIVDLTPVDQVAFPSLIKTVVNGGMLDDRVFGSWTRDEVDGGLHDDTIYGFGGDDELLGNDGWDYLLGGSGNDVLSGGNHVDYAYGEEGNDAISGGFDGDFLFGHDGMDTISGESGYDLILGGPGDDRLFGNNDGDVIEGNAGNDTIDGGDGPDVLWSNLPGGPVDQPWRLDGQGNPAWINMDPSGPDNDGDCDVEDSHPDLDGFPCTSNGVVANDDVGFISHISVLNVGAPGVIANDLFGTPPPSPHVEEWQTALNGQLALNADGSFRFDPLDTFVGRTAFYYHLWQGAVRSAWPAVVIIDVTNAPPWATDDNPPPTGWQMPLTFNILSNDGDPDGDVLDIVDPAGPDIVQVPPTKGTLIVNHDTGQVTYTYTGPNPGMMGTRDSFHYKVKDNWIESQGLAGLTHRF